MTFKFLMKASFGSVGQILVVPFVPQQDLSAFSTGSLRVTKPDGSVESWVGTLDTSEKTVTYTTTSGDLDQRGIWQIQPVAGTAQGLPLLLEVF